MLWLVSICMVNFSSFDHFLDINPVQMFLSETLLFFFLGLCVLQKEDTDEEVHKKEGTDKNKDHKEIAVEDLVLKWGAFIFRSCIHRLSHVVWPSFKSWNDKQSHHCLKNVVVVSLTSNPRSSRGVAIVLSVESVLASLPLAIEQLSGEQIDSKNGKH